MSTSEGSVLVLAPKTRYCQVLLVEEALAVELIRACLEVLGLLGAA